MTDNTNDPVRVLREAAQAALQYHGVSLQTFPAQDAWTYHRVSERLRDALAKTAAIPHSEQRETVAAGEVVRIVKDWPFCNPVCDYEDPTGTCHDNRSETCSCAAAKASMARQRLAPVAAPVPEAKVEHVGDTPESMAASNTRFAIDGAIQYGRENRNAPPSAEHWLYEYWNIGRQLATLGATGWDNVTPMAAPAVKHEASELPSVEKLMADMDAMRDEFADLSRALSFWLPRVPAEAGPIQDRVVQDAYFLTDGPADDKCAQELGWITLNTPALAPSVLELLNNLHGTAPIRSDMPEPFGGVIVLLETLAEVGMTAKREGHPTANSRLCLRFAAELRAYIDSRSPVAAAPKRAGRKADRANLELVIVRLEQIAGNTTDDYRNSAEEALVCARALSAAAPSADAKDSQ